MSIDASVVVRDGRAFEARAGGKEIRVVKPNNNAILPDRKDVLLRRIGNAQSEIGRLNKLLDEIRADVLHLTTE